MTFSKGELIYHFYSDGMFATSSVLENLYEISRISKVDIIEFNIIQGTINNYSSVMTAINLKKDRNIILYGKEIFNKSYFSTNNSIQSNFNNVICSKIFRKKVKNKVVNYFGEIGLNNFKNWNYEEDQFLIDLINLYSDIYLYIDSIYYFLYINPSKLRKKANKTEIFENYIKYFYYFNALLKRYQLNNDFLIYKIIKIFNMNFDVNKNNFIIFTNFIKEININKYNHTKYFDNGYKSLLNDCNYFYNKFK